MTLAYSPGCFPFMKKPIKFSNLVMHIMCYFRCQFDIKAGRNIVVIHTFMYFCARKYDILILMTALFVP